MKSSSRSCSSITCTGSLTKHKRRNFHVMRNPLRMHCYANKQFFFLFLSCTSSCSNFYSFVFLHFHDFHINIIIFYFISIFMGTEQEERKHFSLKPFSHTERGRLNQMILQNCYFYFLVEIQCFP